MAIVPLKVSLVDIPVGPRQEARPVPIPKRVAFSRILRPTRGRLRSRHAGGSKGHCHRIASHPVRLHQRRRNRCIQIRVIGHAKPRVHIIHMHVSQRGIARVPGETVLAVHSLLHVALDGRVGVLGVDSSNRRTLVCIITR
eukprot:scaffold555593_cov47-Attheya_sp.AAC.2